MALINDKMAVIGNDIVNFVFANQALISATPITWVALRRQWC